MHVTVTGATGYTGRHITARLLADGHRVQSITGHPDRPSPFGDQVPLRPFHFDDPHQLAATLVGSDALINTYWVRFAHGDRTYAQAVENTRTLFDAARRAGVRRVVHISIAQADRSQLPYFLGKAALEADLRASGVSHAIIRPTVIYGGGRDVLLNNIGLVPPPVSAVPTPVRGLRHPARPRRGPGRPSSGRSRQHPGCPRGRSRSRDLPIPRPGSSHP